MMPDLRPPPPLIPNCYVSAAVIHAALRMNINDLTDKIIGCATRVHRALGPGLLESAYESCFEDELLTDALNVRRQVRLPLKYKGLNLIPICEPCIR